MMGGSALFTVLMVVMMVVMFSGSHRGGADPGRN
jgi:hypothetical protein